MLNEVAARFVQQRSDYLEGLLSLSEELSFVPSPLWASFVLDMASSKQLAARKAFVASKARSIREMIPTSNRFLPSVKRELDHFAQLSLLKEKDATSLSKIEFMV